MLKLHNANAYERDNVEYGGTVATTANALYMELYMRNDLS